VEPVEAIKQLCNFFRHERIKETRIASFYIGVQSDAFKARSQNFEKLPLDGFSRNLLFEYFSKTYPENSSIT